jgi:signal transduction histidine kinase
VSHEFRTPLTLMLGPLEDALAAGELAPDQRHKLEIAHRNSLRLLKLVNTLLDFSRIEAGRIQASYEPTDLSALTAELASVFRSAIERAGLKLVVNCAPLAEPVYVDREMWEKIVLNLLSNAFKFTFEGEIAVTLQPAEDHAVALTVRDSGIGIAPQEMAYLFERFYRIRGARARTDEGAGIGLALIQDLARLHGGAVRVESSPGAGSAFTVTLPLGAGHLPHERIQKPRPMASIALGAAPFVEEALRWLPDDPEASDILPFSPVEPALTLVDGTPPSTWPHTARILLVEDNADMRAYLRRLLVDADWQVETAADGNSALARALARPPDLVLSDVMMPGLDGIGLLHALRANPRTQTVPVILVSARAGEEAKVEGLEALADDYLMKPFSARELRSRVQVHLDLARLRQEVAERQTREKVLVETTRRMEEFLGLATHELRTPLTSLKGNIELLMRPARVESGDVLSSREQDLLQRSQRQVLRLERLIADLVDMAALQQGRLSLQLASCDLGTVVQEAVEDLRQRHPTRMLRYVTASVPLPVRADRVRVGQVITNYLTNALTYSSATQPVTIEIAPEGKAVRVKVVDQGPGIALDEQVHLWERFYRVPGQGHRSGSHMGLGLGLYLCKTLIEQQGGQVGVESIPGQGATFWFTLPLARTRHREG